MPEFLFALSEVTEKQSESCLSEVFCSKVISKRVFGFNVDCAGEHHK